jgi:hypothetical protein
VAVPVIKAPNDNPRDDDLECQQALEPSFLSIIEEAVAAGWPRRLVLQSLGDLADNLGLMRSNSDRGRTTGRRQLRSLSVLPCRHQ